MTTVNTSVPAGGATPAGTQTSAGSGTGAGSGGVPPAGSGSDANGAGLPFLAGGIDITTEELEFLLMLSTGLVLDEQLRAQMLDAQGNAQKMKKVQESIKKKLTDLIEAEAAKGKKSLLGKIGDWFKKIGTAVAAALAVALAACAVLATGGAAAPLLAVAIVFAVVAFVDLASKINVEAGGKPFSVGGLFKKAVSGMLEAMGVDKKTADKIATFSAVACPLLMIAAPELLNDFAKELAIAFGMSEEQAKKFAMAITIVVTVVVAIALAVFTGGASCSQAMSSLAKTMTRIGNVAQGTATAVAGAGDVMMGSANLDKANADLKISTADAAVKIFKAMFLQIQKEMAQDCEDAKQTAKLEQQLYTIVRAILGDKAATTDAIWGTVAPA